MYCVKCGVKLADSEQRCPLCGTVAFHPDLHRETVEPMYPPHRYPTPMENPKTAQIILTTVTLMALFITMLCDVQSNGRILWSGYVAGALLLGYIVLVLPLWFRKREPVIFIPSSFAAVVIYLLYINHVTEGSWFLSLAFPVTAYVGLVVTGVAALIKIRRSWALYVLGGAGVALGILMPLMEFLICITFASVRYIGWGWYPMIVLVLLGAMLIFLAIHNPARETMERKFFV